MKKKMIAILALATMVMGTSVTAAAAETEPATEIAAEAATDAAKETEERDYNPEEGKGWLVAEINEEPVEFEYDGVTKGITGTTYTFKSEDFTMSVVFNKSLEVDKEMDKNAITQIEVVSSDKASVGYYFTKKSSGKDVESTVTLKEKSDEGLLQGEFTVTVPTAERYVGDNKPGILPELKFTAGEFCFHVSDKKK